MRQNNQHARRGYHLMLHEQLEDLNWVQTMNHLVRLLHSLKHPNQKAVEIQDYQVRHRIVKSRNYFHRRSCL